MMTHFFCPGSFHLTDPVGFITRSLNDRTREAMANIRLDNDFSPLSRSEWAAHPCSWHYLITEYVLTVEIHACKKNLCISHCKKNCFHFSQSVHIVLSKKTPPLLCNITQVTSARFGSHCQHSILSAGIYASVIHVLAGHIIPKLSSVNSKSEKNNRERKMRRPKGDGQKQTVSLCGHKWNN